MRWTINSICVLLALACLAPAISGQKRRTRSKPIRGYTIMAGGLGRVPRDAKDMWGNTVNAHLEFIAAARINLVVIEVPYGVNKRHPRSSTVASLIKRLKSKKIRVWIIYPHAAVQRFDLPRQVESTGKRVEWKCCFNQQATQDWLVENGKKIVAAYRPDGLLLFGLFHKGSGCYCASCRASDDARTGKSMERFFLRLSRGLRELQPGIQLGTTGFWSRASRKTLATVDIVSPVAGIWRPGYAKGRVKKELSGLRGKYKGKLLVPYVKLFLASQTHSTTEDVLGAVKESLAYGDGFFLWGYNPGHSYERQDYDHKRITKALRELAGKKRGR